MAHLSSLVYLRALKQGLQLVPYIKSHRIFRHSQFNHQLNIARAQYSDSSDSGSTGTRDLPRKFYSQELGSGNDKRDLEHAEKVSLGDDRNYKNREDGFGRNYGHKEGGFESNNVHKGERDRNYNHRAGRFDKNYHREERFDKNYHREGRFGRKFDHREGGFDRKYDHREGGFDRNYNHRYSRFDRNYNHREDRFEHGEGTIDSNYGHRKDGYDRNYDQREGRFEHRAGTIDSNYGRSRNYDQREGRFERIGSQYDQSYGPKEDRNYGRRKVWNKNYDQSWMEGNDINGNDNHIHRRHSYDTRHNSEVNKKFLHDNVTMKFTDEELKDNAFFGKPRFSPRVAYNKNRYESRDNVMKESNHEEELQTFSEFEEDYEIDREVQIQDLDPDEIAASHRNDNYQRHGAYKHIRYDQPKSSPNREEEGPTPNSEANIDISNFSSKSVLRRFNSDPQINSKNSFGSHTNQDVNDSRKWKKSYGSLGDSKYDRREDEDHEEEFLKPHRRLSSTGRKNVPYWYALQMKNLAKKGKIQEAVDVLEIWMLERDKVLPDHYTFNVLINILAKAGQTQKTFQIFNKMKKMGYYANAFVYSSLFNACANSPWKSDGLQRAKKLREIMNEKDWTPNYITSTAMIKAFGKCGDLKTCFEIMDQICVRYPNELESSCFSTLLSVCVTGEKNGFRLALEVWQKMQDMGIKPTGAIYNFMLKAVRDNHFDLQLPKQHESDTFIQDSDSHTLLLSESFEENSLITREQLPNFLTEKQENIEEVLSKIDFSKRPNKLALFGGTDTVLQHMKSNQVQPDIRIFSLLLDCSEHTVEAEDKLLEMMKEQKVKPDQEFFNTLIRKRALRWDNNDARAVLQLMTDYHLQPNMDTFKCLALTCHQEQDGIQLLKDIEALDSEPTLEVFSNLVKKSNLNFHYKTQLLIRMEDIKMKPDKMLITVIENHIEKGKNLLVKKENDQLKGEMVQNLRGLKTGFEHFMRYYKGWLHRTNIEEPEHPYKILRKKQSEK